MRTATQKAKSGSISIWQKCRGSIRLEPSQSRLPQGGRTFFTHRRKAVVANPSGRARPLTRFDQADRGYSPGRAARGGFYDGTTSGANVSGHGAGVSTFGKFAEGDPERMAA